MAKSIRSKKQKKLRSLKRSTWLKASEEKVLRGTREKLEKYTGVKSSTKLLETLSKRGMRTLHFAFVKRRNYNNNARASPVVHEGTLVQVEDGILFTLVSMLAADLLRGKMQNQITCLAELAVHLWRDVGEAIERH